MTPAEVQALNAAGLQVVTVFQETKGHMLGGRVVGVQAAQGSQEVAGACGMPPGRPHYFALDIDPNPLTGPQWDAVKAYLDGAASVLGRDQVGVYGGYRAIELLVPDSARWGWQTSSWSAGRWSSKAALQQYRHNIDRCGGTIDLDQALVPDYGGWRSTPMQLVTRAQWDARPPKSITPLVLSAQAGTAVHYTASDADEQADHARCADRVKGIQTFHMDSNGWADIAYSYLPCKHGWVFEGRRRGVRTAAQGTTAGNDAYHAVCFLGDDSAGRDDVTDAGRLAVRQAVEYCNAWSGATGVRPHSSFKATACPGDELRAWIARGMPIITKEEDMPLNDADLKAVREVVNTEVVEVLRAGFGGLVPGSDNQTVRASQGYLFGQVASHGSRLAALEASFTQAATGLQKIVDLLERVEGADPLTIAKAVNDDHAARMAPRS